MNDKEFFLVEYKDRDPENGNYIVKRVEDGEVLSIPAASSIYILSLEQGQMLLMFLPKGQPHGYLFAPI